MGGDNWASCFFYSVKNAALSVLPTSILPGLISKHEKLKIVHRFTISTLRNFGMGKKLMSEWISEEAHYLVEKIASFEGDLMVQEMLFLYLLIYTTISHLYMYNTRQCTMCSCLHFTTTTL